MTTGFIGLGTLGRAIAARLLTQGTDLLVWNRTLAKAQGLGAPVAASPAEVARRCEVIVLNLRDSDAVRAVLHGPEGLLSADLRGKLVIDTTTNAYDAVPVFHAALREEGAAYLEAPVLGSVKPASTGQLAIYVSGEQAAYDRARPLLEMVGSRIEYFGVQPGIATALKLVNNMVMGAFLAALVEGLLLGEAVGVDKARMLDLLEAGAGRSGVIAAKREALLNEDFTVNFAAELIHKDLAYAGELARALKRPLFSGSAAQEVYALAFLQGVADQDFSVIYDVLKGSRP